MHSLSKDLRVATIDCRSVLNSSCPMLSRFVPQFAPQCNAPLLLSHHGCWTSYQVASFNFSDLVFQGHNNMYFVLLVFQASHNNFTTLEYHDVSAYFSDADAPIADCHG